MENKDTFCSTNLCRILHSHYGITINEALQKIHNFPVASWTKSVKKENNSLRPNVAFICNDIRNDNYLLFVQELPKNGMSPFSSWGRITNFMYSIYYSIENEFIFGGLNSESNWLWPAGPAACMVYADRSNSLSITFPRRSLSSWLQEKKKRKKSVFPNSNLIAYPTVKSD